MNANETRLVHAYEGPTFGKTLAACFACGLYQRPGIDTPGGILEAQSFLIFACVSQSKLPAGARCPVSDRLAFEAERRLAIATAGSR